MFLSYLIYIVYATLRAADYLYVPRDARGGSAPATKLLDVPSPHPLNDAAINKLSAVVNAAPTVAHVPRDMVPDDFAGIEDLLAPTDAGSEGGAGGDEGGEGGIGGSGGGDGGGGDGGGGHTAAQV